MYLQLNHKLARKLLIFLILLQCSLRSISTSNQCQTDNSQDETCLTTTVTNANNNNNLNFNNECNCQPYSIPEEDGGARIAYLITLHNQRTLDESATLLKRIVAPGFIVLIHVDTKFPKEEWAGNSNEMMQFINDDGCNCCGATVVVESHFDCKWGKWSMLDPTLWGK